MKHAYLFNETIECPAGGTVTVTGECWFAELEHCGILADLSIANDACSAVPGMVAVDSVDMLLLIASYQCLFDVVCFFVEGCFGEPEEICDNGIDDDLDMRIDCADVLDCAGDPLCYETDCDDGLDNDGDGRVDCDDGSCIKTPACATPS